MTCFRALRKNEIAGAALDVVEDEPLKDQRRKRKTPNLIVTCHSGFYSITSGVGDEAQGGSFSQRYH